MSAARRGREQSMNEHESANSGPPDGERMQEAFNAFAKADIDWDGDPGGLDELADLLTEMLNAGGVPPDARKPVLELGTAAYVKWLDEYRARLSAASERGDDFVLWSPSKERWVLNPEYARGLRTVVVEASEDVVAGHIAKGGTPLPPPGWPAFWPQSIAMIWAIETMRATYKSMPPRP